jgi:hypothetical protein
VKDFEDFDLNNRAIYIDRPENVTKANLQNYKGLALNFNNQPTMEVAINHVIAIAEKSREWRSLEKIH